MSLLAAALMIAAPAKAELDVAISNLRNTRGMLHVCLTRSAAHFPDCSRDPAAIKRTLPAAATTLRFVDLEPGHYAVTILHDENGNGKLDTVLGIPREGFGFSRNPKVRFGAPRFKDVGIAIGGGYARQSVRLQYLL